MKALKSLLVVGLFLVGIGFTSCNNEDDYVTPQPENPVAEVPGHPEVEPPRVEPF